LEFNIVDHYNYGNGGTNGEGRFLMLGILYISAGGEFGMSGTDLRVRKKPKRAKGRGNLKVD